MSAPRLTEAQRRALETEGRRDGERFGRSLFGLVADDLRRVGGAQKAYWHGCGPGIEAYHAGRADLEAGEK